MFYIHPTIWTTQNCESRGSEITVTALLLSLVGNVGEINASFKKNRGTKTENIVIAEISSCHLWFLVKQKTLSSNC